MRKAVLSICVLLFYITAVWGEDFSIKIKAPSSIAEGSFYKNGEPKASLAIVQPQTRKVIWLYDGRYYTIETLNPISVGIDEGGNLWIGDGALNAVIKISSQGNRLSFICYQNNELIDNPVDFDFIWGNTIIVDNLKGNVIVLDANMNGNVLITGLINPTAVYIKPSIISAPIKTNKRDGNSVWEIADLYVSHLNPAGYFDTNHPVIRKYLTDLITATFQKEYAKDFIEYPAEVSIIDNNTLMILDGHLAKIEYFDLATNELIKREGKYGEEPYGWRNPSDFTLIQKCALITDTSNDRIVFHPIDSNNNSCLALLSSLQNSLEPIGNISNINSSLRILDCQAK